MYANIAAEPEYVIIATERGLFTDSLIKLTAIG